MTIDTKEHHGANHEENMQSIDSQRVALPPKVNVLQFSLKEKVKDLTRQLNEANQILKKEKSKFKILKAENKNSTELSSKKYHLKTLKANKSSLTSQIKLLKNQLNLL